jgi:carboxyl-terminal processing protease
MKNKNLLKQEAEKDIIEKKVQSKKLPKKENNQEILKSLNKYKYLTGFFVLTTIFLSIFSGLLLFSSFNQSFNSKSFSKPRPTVRDEILSLIKEYSIKDFPTDKEIQEAELRGLVSSLKDPYTAYFPAVENENFKNNLNQRYEGVGILFETIKNQIFVKQVFENSPAKKSGVKNGDILQKVNSEDITGQEIGVVAEKIRGEKGTEVVLQFLRGNEVKEFRITRDKIELELVSLNFLENDTIARLKITSFGDNMSSLMEEKIKLIKEKPVKTIIVDVTGNSGGLLSETIEVASYFMPENQVVVREQTKDSKKVLRSNFKETNLLDYEVVVMVDEFSASASEILAGALRDNRNSKLIGRKTFGKGTVQQIFDLSNSDSLKLTIAKWFTPNETEIDQIGLKPDVEVSKEDDILEAAVKFILNQK